MVKYQININLPPILTPETRIVAEDSEPVGFEKINSSEGHVYGWQRYFAATVDDAIKYFRVETTISVLKGYSRQLALERNEPIIYIDIEITNVDLDNESASFLEKPERPITISDIIADEALDALYFIQL